MIHTLENGLLRLELAPRLGASVVNFAAQVDGEWQAVLRFTTPERFAQAQRAGSASGLASFTLAPFSNRIPGARFAFEGREYVLRPNTPEGNAQHGDVRGCPHRVVEVTPTSAEYVLDTREFPDFNYPLAFVLRTTYELRGDTLSQTLALTNAAQQRAPFGFGLHPYFSRTLGGAADLALSFAARGVYPVDDTLIPRGAMEATAPELDFTAPRPLGEQQLNTLYGGLAGPVVLRWAGTPYRLELSADPVFSHLVLFTPPDGSLAVEPVSHATDAFNLHERGVHDLGFTALEGGETLRGSVRFRFVEADEDE